MAGPAPVQPVASATVYCPPLASPPSRANLFSFVNARKRHALQPISTRAWFPERLVHNFIALHSTRATKRGAFNATFSPCGSFVAVTCEDQRLSLVDPHSSRLVCSLRGHDDPVNDACFLDDRMVLTASDDCCVRQYDLRKQACVQTFRGHQQWVKNVCKIDRRTFLSSSIDGTVRVWRTQDEHGGGLGMASGPDVSPNVVLDCDVYRASVNMLTDSGRPQLAVSTTTGGLFLVHDLDVTATEGTGPVSFDPDEVLEDCMHGELSDVCTARVNRVEPLFAATDLDSEGHFNALQFDYSTGTHLLTRHTGFLDDESVDQCLAFDVRDSTPPICSTLCPTFGNGAIRSRHCWRLVDSSSHNNYIKGPCFSSCSRFVCSPFYNGVRIARFQPQDLPFVPTTHQEWPVVDNVALCNTHSDGVLACAYHPHLPIFATVGLDGFVKVYGLQL